jgi:hypothetical protein
MNTQPTTTKTGKQNSGILPCKNPGGLLVVVSVMQPQPTSKPSPAHPNRCDDSAAGQSGQHSQLSPRTLLRHAIQGDVVSERVGQDSDPSFYKVGGVTPSNISTMKIKKLHPNGTALLPEGTYAAVVKQVEFKNKAGTEEAAKVVIEFDLTGRDQALKREYSPRIESRSPLLHDSVTILGRRLSSEEEADGLDPAILQGRNCQVVVRHRPDNNGKLKANAATVLGAVPMPSN